jgi:peptidoglycan/LPS O-acetylase OafA/YrhL
VISGFLITKLLLEEQARTGRISVPQFYLRRAFRILPAAYVYIAICALLVPLGVRLFYSDLPSVLLYYANYHVHAAKSALGQFWSLSVEEQFYFLWPGVLGMLGHRRARYSCAVLLLTAPAFRLLQYFGMWPAPSGSFESVCDALATGCLLALLREPLWNMRAYRGIVESSALWVIAVIAVLLTCSGMPLIICDGIGITLLNISIAMLLDRYMRLPTLHVGRFLNAVPIAWIGTISYSLYVWQQPWMFSSLALPVRLAGAVGCATASYYLIERPALRLRRLFAIGSGQPR